MRCICWPLLELFPATLCVLRCGFQTAAAYSRIGCTLVLYKAMKDSESRCLNDLFMRPSVLLAVVEFVFVEVL